MESWLDYSSRLVQSYISLVGGLVICNTCRLFTINKVRAGIENFNQVLGLEYPICRMHRQRGGRPRTVTSTSWVTLLGAWCIAQCSCDITDMISHWLWKILAMANQLLASSENAPPPKFPPRPGGPEFHHDNRVADLYRHVRLSHPRLITVGLYVCTSSFTFWIFELATISTLSPGGGSK